MAGSNTAPVQRRDAPPPQHSSTAGAGLTTHFNGNRGRFGVGLQLGLQHRKQHA